MQILVTGAAGFIGYHLSEKLLARGDRVIGLDNLNDYYDVSLKEARLERLRRQDHFTFVKADLRDRDALNALFEATRFDAVINLAAQAGVRYSLENPHAYIDSNVIGFTNILECCRHHRIGHLVYASSSSVYGMNGSMPFSVHDNVDHPISLYAATKKANELMAHTYSHLYNIPTTGLRFFTVYGPWGRPDMAPYKFAEAMLRGTPIDVYNHGEMWRDFTYVEDLARAIRLLIDAVPVRPDAPEQIAEGDSLSPVAPWRVVNIGNSDKIKLSDFIDTIEAALGVTAIRNLMEMQKGDVPETWADGTLLTQLTGYRPKTDLATGIAKVVAWHLDWTGRT